MWRGKAIHSRCDESIIASAHLPLLMVVHLIENHTIVCCRRVA
eukprot:COSAG02_NODE_61634_length_268_cov_0.609467_2_plen_42_part_01